MVTTLGERTAETVRIYFEKANRPEIKKVLPQKAKTVEEALADYEKTRLPGATSFGQTILADGRYVGDVWCYAGGDIYWEAFEAADLTKFAEQAGLDVILCEKGSIYKPEDGTILHCLCRK